MFFKRVLISADVIVSSTKVKVPFSFISLAALRNAPMATRESAAPRLIRRAPVATRSATEKLSPLIPESAFTGFGSDGGADFADCFEVRKARRVEDVSAGSGEGLEAADRVVKIVAAVKKILGARGERERKRERARGFDGGGDAFDGVLVIVNRAVLIASGVFDGAADNSCGAGEANRLRDEARDVTEGIFEIGADRKIGGCGDRGAMREGFFAFYFAIAATEGEGETGACGGESFETETGEHAGRTCVPRIRDDEGAESRGAERAARLADFGGEAVKGAEFDCFIELAETHSILFSGREVRG